MKPQWVSVGTEYHVFTTFRAVSNQGYPCRHQHRTWETAQRCRRKGRMSHLEGWTGEKWERII